MNEKTFSFHSPVRNATFEVREDYTLALDLTCATGKRTLVFHDFIRRGGRR